MEKRLLLVFALTFIVIILFQPILKKYFPQPPASTAPTQQASTGTTGSAPASDSVSAQSVAAVPPAAIQQGAKQASSESETVIENDLYKIRFTNKGGLVKSWILKKYTDDKGGPLELVNNAAADQHGYPLSLWTYDDTQRN